MPLSTCFLQRNPNSREFVHALSLDYFAGIAIPTSFLLRRAEVCAYD